MAGLSPEQIGAVSGRSQSDMGMILNTLAGQQQEERARQSLPSEIEARSAQAEVHRESAKATRAQREFEASPEGKELRQAKQVVESTKAQAELMVAQAKMAGIPAEEAKAKAALAKAELDMKEFAQIEEILNWANEGDLSVSTAAGKLPLSLFIAKPELGGHLIWKPGADQMFAQELVKLKLAPNIVTAQRLLKDTSPQEAMVKIMTAMAGGVIPLDEAGVKNIQKFMDMAFEGGTEDQIAAWQITEELKGLLGPRPQ